MYLSESCFVLFTWVVASVVGGYPWFEPQNRIQLYRVTVGAIPVVRPSGFVRPNKFRNPTTTRRPFRRRPSTMKPQQFPFAAPPMTATQAPLVMAPLTSPKPDASQNMPIQGVPMSAAPYATGSLLSDTGTIQTSSPENNEGLGTISFSQNTPMMTVIERPPAELLQPSQPPQSLPVEFPPPPSFIPKPVTLQLTTTRPDVPFPPQTPLEFPVVRPPAFTMFRPIPKPSVRPPVSSQPNKEPPKNPNAQPPFDSGPYVPPKPPPVPSTSNFGVNPAPPSNGKPQRPLPPSRPILHKPPPPPPPSFQLTTTEKPALLYSESTMSEDGNYAFDFLVSNSVYRREQGFLKKSLVKPWGQVLVKTGAYSFMSPEGTLHRVDFVADENGYRAFESSS